jgi:DNA-binding Lrp family transcriptional regulator
MPGSSQPVIAYFMAIVKKGTEHEVAKKLQKLNGVADALVTYGLYDIVVRIETPNLGQLDALITEMRKIEEILQTTTLVGA